MLCMGVAGAMSASYTTVLLTTQNTWDREAKTVTINVTKAIVYDAAYNIVTGEVQIAFDVYRSEAHGTATKVGSIAAAKFVNSLPQTEVKFVDTNLPDPGAGGSTLLEYSMYAKIGAFRSEAISVGTIVIDYQNKPTPVTNLKATLAEDKSSVTVSFNCPTHFTNGKEIKSFNKIVVSKYEYSTYSWKSRKTFRSTQCKPGEALSWTDNDIEGATMVDYQVIVYTQDGMVTIEDGSGGTTEVARIMSSEEARVSLYLGEDYPSGLQSLKCEYKDGANVLSWTLNTKGFYGGTVDAATVKYRVQRSIEGGSYVDLATDIAGNSYTDTQLAAHASSYIYLVTPYNEVGTGSYSSASIYAGEPYTLPFEETVGARTSYDNSGWLATTVNGNGSGGWCAAGYMQDTKNMRYVYDKESTSSGVIANLLYTEQKRDGRYDYLRSAPIKSEGHKQFLLTIDYYAMSGFDNVLAIELGNDEEQYTEIERIQYDTISSEGWRTDSVTVDDFTTSEVLYVRVISIKGVNSNSVAVDNIKLEALDEKPTRIPQTSESAGDKAKAVKILRGGEIVILRDGKMYDVMGRRY